MNIKRSIAVIAAVLALFLLMAGSAAAEGDGGYQAAGASGTWFMAEGCTDYGMETWLLLQNPWDADSNVQVTFITEAGVHGTPLALTVPAESRRTIDVGAYLVSGQVSVSVVTTSGAPVIAERAMYGNGRTWGTATMGAPYAPSAWYFAEGCTAGGMETWLLVLNPYDTDAVIDIDLMTESGPVPGLTGQAVPAFSRRTFDLGETVSTYDLAASVVATSGQVVCERTMYGAGRAWATGTVGTPQTDITWNFAEGCTAGGMETWLLLVNQGDKDAQFSVDFYSGGIKTSGPSAVELPAHTRRSVNVGDWIESYEVSSIVTANEGIVCERSMYGGSAPGPPPPPPSAAWPCGGGCFPRGAPRAASRPGSSPSTPRKKTRSSR